MFRKAEKTFLWIHFCQPFSPNYENILFNWCRIYFLQYLDWVHVNGTCHWVGIPTVNAVSYRPSVERLNQAPCFTSGFLVASKQYGGLCVLSNLSLCLYVLIWIHILFRLQFCIFIHNGKHGCFNEGAKARTKALSTFKQAPRYIWGKYKTLL